jgi:hypothetical protein
MSDEPTASSASSGTTPEPEHEPASTSSADAWEEVLGAMRELGDAVSSWAQTAAQDPETRRHLDELRSGVSDMAREADEAFTSLSNSDFGKSVSQGASQAGEAIGNAAMEFGQAAAPHVAAAFAGLAEVFGQAAQHMGEAAEKRSAASAKASAPASAPDVPASEEPGAQPPTGAGAETPEGQS